MVEMVAGLANWGVSLELLAKEAVIKKSGRGRRFWGRQRRRSQGRQKTAPEKTQSHVTSEAVGDVRRRQALRQRRRSTGLQKAPGGQSKVGRTRCRAARES